MEEITSIRNKNGIEIIFQNYIPVEKAILLARENGLVGRLTIQHKWINKNEEVVCTEYNITNENKIVCAIFPYLLSKS